MRSGSLQRNAATLSALVSRGAGPESRRTALPWQLPYCVTAMRDLSKACAAIGDSTLTIAEGGWRRPSATLGGKDSALCRLDAPCGRAIANKW